MQTVTKELNNKSGIYCLLNIINQKKYIGSSKNLSERLINHRGMLRRNSHYNPILQNSYNKYGEDNFVFVILELCDTLIEKEQFYFDNLKPEFNIVSHITENNVTGKEIHQYDLNGNYVKKYDYIKQACLENNIHQSTICRYLNGTYKKGGGYLWSLDYKEKMEPYKKEKRKITKLEKPVQVIDARTRQTFKEFKSLKDCANYFGYFPSEISNGIKKNRKFKRKYFIRFKAALGGDI